MPQNVDAARVVITVETNADRATGQLQKLERQGPKTAQGFKAIKNVALGAALIAIANEAKNLTIALVRAGSDAAETANKFEAVFGTIAREAEEAQLRLEQAFGLSSVSAQQFLADTGDLLVGFGFARDEALAFSEQIASLGIDLASFTNFSGGAEGAVSALQRAILGEREAIKSLGLAISEADIQRLAESRGIVGALDRQTKAALTLELAVMQSGAAIGDFERSAGTLANELRLTQGASEDLAADLGTLLQPAAIEIQRIIRDFIDIIGAVPEGFQAFGVALVGTAGAIGILQGALTLLGTTLFGPIGIIIGIGAAAAALALLIKRARDFENEQLDEEYADVAESLEITGRKAQQLTFLLEQAAEGGLTAAEAIADIAEGADVDPAALTDYALTLDSISGEFRDQLVSLEAQQTEQENLARGYQELAEFVRQEREDQEAIQAAIEEQNRLLEEQLQTQRNLAGTLTDDIVTAITGLDRAFRAGLIDQEDFLTRVVGLREQLADAILSEVEGSGQLTGELANLFRVNERLLQGNKDALQGLIDTREDAARDIQEIEEERIQFERDLAAQQLTEFADGESQRVEIVDEAAEQIEQIYKDLSESIGQALEDGFVSLLQSVGALTQALATGEDAWAAFARSGLESIAAVVDAIGQQLAAQALTALPNLGLSAALAGGAIAAFAAAGLIRGQAQNFQVGTGPEGFQTPITSARDQQLIAVDDGETVTVGQEGEEGGSGTVILQVDGTALGQVISDLAANGDIVIDRRAVRVV